MPRNYQPAKNNKYWLPHNVYMRVLYIVRDYPRMKAEQNDIIHTAPADEYNGSKKEHGDPTANKAVKIAMMSRETDAVDYAMKKIPIEYRNAIWVNITHGKSAEQSSALIPAHKNTFRLWRSRFCYYIAERLHYI